MNDELNLYRAVAQARQDIAEGIEQSTAVRDAARRFGVPVEAVQAYAVIAHKACCAAATEVENGTGY